jgi:hypothetical protein
LLASKIKASRILSKAWRKHQADQISILEVEINVQRQKVITQPFHPSHTSFSSLYLFPASLFNYSSHKSSLTPSVTENSMRFSSIVLLLGAVNCTLAASIPAVPAKGAAKGANGGVAPSSTTKAVTLVPVAGGKGVTPLPANGSGTSPTSVKSGAVVTTTVAQKPFDGKSSISYRPEPFQCSC